jgi:hypothetical protein
MASNDESSSDDENNSFLNKGPLMSSDDCVRCCKSFGRSAEKCSCKMSNNLNHNGEETSKSQIIFLFSKMLKRNRDVLVYSE